MINGLDHRNHNDYVINTLIIGRGGYQWSESGLKIKRSRVNNNNNNNLLLGSSITKKWFT